MNTNKKIDITPEVQARFVKMYTDRAKKGGRIRKPGAMSLYVNTWYPKLRDARYNYMTLEPVLFFRGQVEDAYRMGYDEIILECDTYGVNQFWAGSGEVRTSVLYDWISLMALQVTKRGGKEKHWGMHWIIPTRDPAAVPEVLKRVAQYAFQEGLPHAATIDRWADGKYAPDNVSLEAYPLRKEGV